MNITLAGNEYNLIFSRTDLQLKQNFREAFLTRIKSAVKEANATIFAQAKSALEDNTYKI